MESPWSSINLSHYQGEWACVCQGYNMDMMQPHKQIGAYMYTQVEEVGWVMCGSCQGVWQHTHFPEDSDNAAHPEFADLMLYVYHVCK